MNMEWCDLCVVMVVLRYLVRMCSGLPKASPACQVGLPGRPSRPDIP